MRDKIQTYSLLALGILAGLILLFVSVKYLLPVTAPFFIAWIMANLSRGVADKLSKRIGINARVLRLATSLFLTAAVFLLISFAIWQVTSAVWSFLTKLGEGGELSGLLKGLTNPSLAIFGDGVPEELARRISEGVNTMISSALSSLATSATSWVAFLPRALLFLLVTVISLLYFAYDIERVNSFLLSLLPRSAGEKLSGLREGLFTMGKKYIRSYLLISVITYFLMLFGFLLLGVEGAAGVALLVAFLDLLPILGVGTVLIPWGIFRLAVGDHFLGVGLLILFAVNEAVRQFTEPKLLGKSLNMHPILTLMLLYIGYALFGIFGLFAAPLAAMVFSVLLKKDHTAKIP